MYCTFFFEKINEIYRQLITIVIENELGGACGTYGGKGSCMQDFGGEA